MMWQLMVFFLAVALLVVVVLLYHEIQFVDEEIEAEDTDDSSDTDDDAIPAVEQLNQWAEEYESQKWHFCTIVIDPDAPADVYSQAQLPLSEQVVIEQNELGEYRSRPLLDVIETDE